MVQDEREAGVDMTDESEPSPPDPKRTSAEDAKLSESDAVALQEGILHELEEQEGPRGRPWYNLVSVAAIVVVGVFAMITGANYGIGEAKEPGPGMWPFALGALTTGLALVVGIRFKRVQDVEKFSAGAIHVLIGVVCMFAFWFLLPLVGFEIPSLLMCVVWLRVLGKEKWRTTAFVSVGIVAAFYVVFIVLLGVPVPRLI